VSEAAEDVPLAERAEALARAVRRHASVLSEGGDLHQTAAAINALRVAARRYLAAVMAQTGWGNVFADLEQAAAPGPVTADPGPQTAAASGAADTMYPVVSYQSRFRLRIRDHQGARHLLQDRAGAAGLSLGEELDDSGSGIIAALAELDGWDPYVYDQDVIEVLSAGWESAAE
jgi:hypothetical protein